MYSIDKYNFEIRKLIKWVKEPEYLVLNSVTLEN